MSSLTSRSFRWLARLIAARPESPAHVTPGTESALDGATALACCEALWCDTACLGAGFPASVAARAFEKLTGRGNAGLNILGTPRSTLPCGSSAGALSAAIGVSSAGRRPALFVSGDELATLDAQLRRAAGARLPLVLHVAARAGPGPAVTFGGGHDTWHAVADAGWGQLFATNAQEAVDLAVVARLVAERTLTPVMVGIDGTETALAVQDVRLPDQAMIKTLLGAPNAQTPPHSEPQRMLFGDTRRLIPTWCSTDEPATLGAAEPPDAARAGRLAGGVFFGADLNSSIADAMHSIAERTGRDVSPVSDHLTHDAELVILAVGAAVETARAAAERIRAQGAARVGVLGLRQTRPWPDDMIASVLTRADHALILERSAPPASGPGPLSRDVLASLAGRQATPAVHSAYHGVGASACDAAEIVSACDAALSGHTGPLLLGINADPTAHTTPRERAELDATRRWIPRLAELAVPAAQRPEPQPDGVTLVSVIRRHGTQDAPAATLVAAMLQKTVGGRLRSLPALDVYRSTGVAIDRIAVGRDAATPTRDPADIGVVVSPLTTLETDPLDDIKDNGTLLVPLTPEGRGPSWIGPGTLARAHSRGITLLGVSVPPPKAYERPEPAWRRHESMAAAAVRTLLDRKPDAGASDDGALDHRRTLLDITSEPEIEARLDAFRAGLAGARPIVPQDIQPQTAGEPKAVPDAPAHAGSPVNRPADQWARVGLPFAEGRAHEIAPHPASSVGVTPARSTVPRTLVPADNQLVRFEPAECTGDGMLWAGCPDGSVHAAALGLDAILRTGLTRAHGADALTPIVGKLARAAHESAHRADRPPTTVREACAPVAGGLIEKMPFDADRRASLGTAFEAVMDAVGDLPIARTAALFTERENAKPGSGAFLVIGFDPDRCAHAGAAAGEAAGRGLTLIDRTDSNLAHARALWSLFDAMPDTPGDVVASARAHPAVGPLAAALLVRSCARALVGGDDAEPGCGARLAVRQVLASCEAEIQPRWQRLLGEIESLRGKLQDKIHEMLAQAVPDGDLDALASGLVSVGGEDAGLNELGRLVSADSPRMDTRTLKLYVDLARELKDVAWKLTEGPTGTGRARYGLAIANAPSTAWLASAPFNPLGAPAIVDASMVTPEMARGLFESLTTEALRLIRVVRMARVALEQPGEADKENARLASLNWDDLTDDERGVCPPVLLLGDRGALARGGLGSLLWLLGSGVPVKAVLLDDAAGGAQPGWGVEALGPYPEGSHASPAMLGLLGRRAYVVQTSIAAGDHLAEGVVGALRFNGPALIAVHAPSPVRHGFEPEKTVAQARLAVESRAVPLLRFDPDAGGVFGSCLDLSGNPDPELVMVEGGPTPLDWMISEARFRDGFRLMGTAPACPARAVLETPKTERDGSPVKVIDPLDRTAWVAPGQLVAFADDRLGLWRTLQELAGVVTPFTSRVEQEAAEAVADERARELAALRAAHERELAELRAGYEGEAVARVREGLLTLAGYAGTDENRRDARPTQDEEGPDA